MSGRVMNVEKNRIREVYRERKGSKVSTKLESEITLLNARSRGTMTSSHIIETLRKLTQSINWRSLFSMFEGRWKF